KIAALKEQIQNDTYEVDADDFADKILEKYFNLF
ncbi:MAG: flagellar biosynthesis anti-sigma factor FlgM, partial [Lachnospiraceae bacterium]|nr:flagellar biosynthesis anti-sigma factor FlgM [Lachnospiraceae bacterium]